MTENVVNYTGQWRPNPGMHLMHCSTNAKEHFILEMCKILLTWDLASKKQTLDSISTRQQDLIVTVKHLLISHKTVNIGHFFFFDGKFSMQEF